MSAQPIPEATLPKPPAGFAVRAPTFDDLGEVIEFLRLCDVHDWGSPDFTEDELRYMWRLPDLDLARDVWLVHGDDGALVAYGWVLVRDEHRQLRGWGVVHPDHRGRGIGSYLMDLRDRAHRLHAALAPPGARVVNLYEMIGPDRGAHELAARYGYHEVRRFWQMIIELHDPVAEATPPDGIHLRTVDRAEDLPPVHDVLEEAFADHWGHVRMAFQDWEQLQTEDPTFDPGLWWLAVEGEGPDERVAGISLGSIDEGEGYVNTLGVRRPWRGRGVGKALLRGSFGDLRNRGIITVKLFVDAANETGATRLYERVGMHVYRTYDVWEKELDGAG